MSTATTGVTAIANAIPEHWAAEISDATKAHIGLADLVDRSFESDMADGDIIHILDWSNPAVSVKAEGTNASFANIVETQQNVTINREAYTYFVVEDIAELQSKHAVRSRYTEKSTYSLMAHVEGDLTSGLMSLPDNFSQSVGSLASEPTTDNLIRARQYLDDGDVPETDRFFYMSPSTATSLLKQNVFTSSDFTDKGAIASGRVSKPVYGATGHVSSLVNNNPSTSGQSYSWYGHKKGVALIMQQSPKIKPMTYSHALFGWETVVSVVYQFAERLIAPSTLGGGSSDDRFSVAVAGA